MTLHFHLMKSPFPQMRGPFPKMMSQFRMITPCRKKTTPFPQTCSYPVLLVVMANHRIPSLQKTTPFSQRCSHPVVFMMAIHKIPIPADTPHSPRTTITSSSSFKLSPPIPPMPKNYKKTTIKGLEKKDKELKKSIISLEKQLEKLNFEKAHIECCLDYFQIEQDNFMETVENYHTTSTPQSNPPSSPRSRSHTPLPVPPRPSFLQCMATSFLSPVPKDNSWSQCDHDTRTYSFHYTYPGTGRANESDPPLLKSFPLFNGCRTPSLCPTYYPSSPDSPVTPRKPRDPMPTYRGQCLCYDCVPGNGCMW